MDEEHNKIVKDQEDIFRPEFHFTPQKGWMNDPNGFCIYQGEYHLFYQHYPDDIVWGPMHWGHAVSKDLITWEHLPVALSPGQYCDANGCFSGSAIEKDGKLYLVYTGNRNIDAEHKKFCQTQCVAVSEDGVHFGKYADNPVIRNEKYTADTDIFDFRDPKIIRRGQNYLCVVGSRTVDGHGQLLLFKSADLLHWSFQSVLFSGDQTMGVMWECPDLFRIGDVDVIVLSPNEMPAQQHRYQNKNSSIWITGQFDAESGNFTMEQYGEIDHGFDFFAPQTVNFGDRHVMIAWMETWKDVYPAGKKGLSWNGAMTIPREISVSESTGELLQHPVAEFDNYCQLLETIQQPGEEIFHKEWSADTAFRLKGKISITPDTVIRIRIGAEQSEHIQLTYDKNQLCMQRRNASCQEDAKRFTDIVAENGIFDMDLILDHSALEGFFDQGRRAMSTRVFLDCDHSEISMDIMNAAGIQQLEIYQCVKEKKIL